MQKPHKHSLYQRGQRKYLSQKERADFLKAAQNLPNEKRLFLQMLFYSGARISEVLQLQKHQIDVVEKMVLIHSLKKRRMDVYRPVPLPVDFMANLAVYMNEISTDKLWLFSRSTASRLVKSVMNTAGIFGIQASAKGLRHSFAVQAILSGVPLTIVKKWLGHQSITTTEIYLEVIGKEERAFYEGMWA